MKRVIIFASGWILLLGGCDRGITDKFDVPSAKIVAMDEAALPEDLEGQLSDIDQKLARIDSQLDQRLGAIERRLLIVEQAAGGPVDAGAAGGLEPTGDQPTGDQPAADQPPADQPAGDQPAGDQPAGDQPTGEPAATADTAATGAAHTASDDKHAYLGPLSCAPCHLPQYSSWKKTKMANAFETLKPGVAVDMKLKHNMDPKIDYTKLPTCVGCRVTGYGKKGGFVDIETTPDLAGVSCEACHGPGGSYIAKGLKKNPQFKKADLLAEGFVDVTAAQCQTCHNVNSPLVDLNYVFDFEANKEKGTHQHFPLLFKH